MPYLAPWDWQTGVREWAATSMAFADVPPGFINTLVVPYDLASGAVLKSATVAHLSNKYCACGCSEFCRVTFKDFNLR